VFLEIEFIDNIRLRADPYVPRAASDETYGTLIRSARKESLEECHTGKLHIGFRIAAPHAHTPSVHSSQEQYCNWQSSDPVDAKLAETAFEDHFCL
jgi:hypothetical protein